MYSSTLVWYHFSRFQCPAYFLDIDFLIAEAIEPVMNNATTPKIMNGNTNMKLSHELEEVPEAFFPGTKIPNTTKNMIMPINEYKRPFLIIGGFTTGTPDDVTDETLAGTGTTETLSVLGLLNSLNKEIRNTRLRTGPSNQLTKPKGR
jgi:hypothetical protein